jgi:hypothetical protein
LIKIKRPDAINNKDVIAKDQQGLKQGTYILISSDMWFMLKAWFDADFKIEIQHKT